MSEPRDDDGAPLWHALGLDADPGGEIEVSVTCSLQAVTRTSWSVAGEMTFTPITGEDFYRTTIDIRKALTQDFYATLERKLAEGWRLGLDVAVCTDDFPLEIRFIEPGGERPLGRRWTIYRTSLWPAWRP